jgi:hypothetical protein
MPIVAPAFEIQDWRASVLIIRLGSSNLGFRICFEFRISSFEFVTTAVIEKILRTSAAGLRSASHLGLPVEPAMPVPARTPA